MAVRLLQAGVDVTMTGYSYKHAQRLRRDYLEHGTDAFDDKRTSNRDRVLTSAQRQQIITDVQSKKPCELIPGCTGQYWTTGLLGAHIFAVTGKRFKSKTSERLLFTEAGLSWHRPGRVYEKADPAAVQAWETETVPVLKKHWHDKNTVVLCADEMVLTSTTTIQKVWLPKGEYPPVIQTNSTRARRNFYGFLNLKTGRQHTFITEKQNMGVTVEVLAKVREVYPGRKLVIFWDNCGWHRGSTVLTWIEADRNTEVIHFPPYTPQLNPQEQVWKAGRKEVSHNRHIADIDEVACQFRDYVQEQRFPYRLLGFHADMAQD